MTGTSLDGLDAALVRIEGAGLEMRGHPLRFHSRPLGDLAPPLRALASGEPFTAGAIADLALRLGEAHADAVRALVAESPAPIDLVCAHGQTVFHAPPRSWQLLNPWPIARAAGCRVICDLRGADLAAGGQGAPITPIADWILFREEARSVAVVNLGGFCNVTILPAAAPGALASDSLSRIRALDVCACNQLLDAVARRAFDQPFDRDGARAFRGAVRRQASEELTAVLAQQSRSDRSLGSGDEAAHWIEAWIARISPDDLAATAANAIAAIISLAIEGAESILIAGGGAHNRALVRFLEQAAGRPLATTETRGIPVSHRESVCFAALGALCADGIPITLPQTTRLPATTPPRAGATIPPP